MPELTITEDDDGVRLDRYLRKILPLKGLSDIYRLIRKGRIKINGKKSKENYRIVVGDKLLLKIAEEEIKFQKTSESIAVKGLVKTEHFRRKFRIIYEDDAILVCDKPSGLVVHSGTGHNNAGSLIDLATSYLQNDKKSTPMLVHRLDRDTSGIVIIAKNMQSLRFLNESLRKHEINKEYIAICHNIPHPLSGTIKVNLQKEYSNNTGMKMRVSSVGQESVSFYKTIISNDIFSKISVKLLTGRTHQIRVHMAHIGCPIVGDIRYGDKNLDNKLKIANGKTPRLCLHAHRITFMHPKFLKELSFECRTPVEFNEFMETA